MFNFFNKKLQKSIIYIGTLCALFLSCHGPVMNLVHAVETSVQTHHETSCCHDGHCDDKVELCLDTSFIVEPLQQGLGILFIIFFLISLMEILRGRAVTKFQLYMRSIRDRYGGFSLFRYLIALFSRGILQPKIFA